MRLASILVNSIIILRGFCQCELSIDLITLILVLYLGFLIIIITTFFAILFFIGESILDFMMNLFQLGFPKYTHSVPVLVETSYLCWGHLICMSVSV